MTERIRCPKCGKQVLAATLNKYGGVCRHCVRCMGGHRMAAIALAIFTVVSLWAMWDFESALASAIADGREMKAHWTIAFFYNSFGIWGTRILFGGMTLLGLFLTHKFTKAWIVERKHVREVSEGRIS